MSAAEVELWSLLAEAVADGGPTPLADALAAWHDRYPWQERRPIERAAAVSLLASLGAPE